MDELRDWLKPVIINAFSEALKWKAQAPERAQVSRKRVYHDDGTTLKVVIGHKTLQPSRHVVQIHDMQFLHGGELHHARVSDSVTYVNAVIHGPALASAGQGDTLQSKPERSKGAYLWIRGLELLIRTGTKGDARVQLRISDAEHLGGAGDKLGGRPISIVAYPQTALLLHNLERLREPKTLGNTASETAETDNSPSHPTSQHRSAAGSATEAVETSTESQSALATQVPRTQARERSAASSVDVGQELRDHLRRLASNRDPGKPASSSSIADVASATTVAETPREEPGSRTARDSETARSPATEVEEVKSPHASTSADLHKGREEENETRSIEEDPWKGISRIRRREIQIPKDQLALLNRPTSWIPPPPGHSSPRRNVPISLLAVWNEEVDRDARRSRRLAEGSPQSPLPRRASSLSATHNRGTSVGSDGLEDEYASDGDESEPASWSPSPPRLTLGELPPDSPLISVGRHTRDQSTVAVNEDSFSPCAKRRRLDVTVDDQRPSQPDQDTPPTPEATASPSATGRSSPTASTGETRKSTKLSLPHVAAEPAIQQPHLTGRSSTHETGSGLTGSVGQDAQYDRDQAFLVPSNSDDEEPALEASVPLAINHLASSSLSEPPPGQGSGHTLTPTASSAMSERLVSTSLGELATPSPNRPLKDASVGLSPLSQLLEWLPSQTSHEAGHASNRTSMSDLLGHNGVQDINQRSASHARLGSPERGSPIRPAIEAEEEADHGACRGAKRKASSTEVFPLLKRAREERQRRSKSRVHEDGDEAKRSPGHGRWDGVSVRACIQDEAHGAPSRTPHHQGQSRPARIASPRPTRGARTNDLTIAAGSEKVTLYEKFQRAYPDYPAPLKTFVGSCAYVEWLVGEQQMEHRSLWDDFVYRQATDYPEWKAKRASRGQLEIPYETFYREEIDESMRTKRILSPNNLAEALELDPIAAGLMRYRTIPAIRSRTRGRLPSQTIVAAETIAPSSGSSLAPGTRPDSQSMKDPMQDVTKDPTQDSTQDPTQTPIQDAIPTTSQDRSISVVARSSPACCPSSPPVRPVPAPQSTRNRRHPMDRAISPPALRRSATLEFSAKPGADGPAPTPAPPPASASQSPPSTQEWWRDHNTPFKLYCRSYALLPSVGGGLGQVTQNGDPVPATRRLDPLNWNL